LHKLNISETEQIESETDNHVMHTRQVRPQENRMAECLLWSELPCLYIIIIICIFVLFMDDSNKVSN